MEKTIWWKAFLACCILHYLSPSLMHSFSELHPSLLQCDGALLYLYLLLSLSPALFLVSNSAQAW